MGMLQRRPSECPFRETIGGQRERQTEAESRTPCDPHRERPREQERHPRGHAGLRTPRPPVRSGQSALEFCIGGSEEGVASRIQESQREAQF